MEKRINRLTCTFENHVLENSFSDFRWKTTSGWVKTCLWFPIGTAIMILIAGLQREMSVTILAILSIINIAGPCYLLLRPDDIKKRFSHILIMPTQNLWAFMAAYLGFLDESIILLLVFPFGSFIYHLKIFPFSFLWNTIPALIAVTVLSVHGNSVLTVQHTEIVSDLATDYYTTLLFVIFVLIYDKWRNEINLREDFLKTQTIEKTKILMHKTLNKYFGDALTEEIISKDGVIEGETKWVTICFTDISSYSTIVEYMSPSVAVKFLNEYFSKMHEVIDKHKGQILNYIGDSIMIVFGAPNNLEDHEKIAVECALEMRTELVSLNEKWDESQLSRYWKNHGIDKIDARIGIHTGNAVTGNIGSDKMLQYSTIGDVVNVASRLEQANKQFDTNICMSQEIFTALTDELVKKSVCSGEITLKGRNTKSKVYSI